MPPTELYLIPQYLELLAVQIGGATLAGPAEGVRIYVQARRDRLHSRSYTPPCSSLPWPNLLTTLRYLR